MASSRNIRLWTIAAAILALSLLACGCGDSLLDVEFENDPAGNFDALWSEFDRYYALFGARHIDWDSLYAVYRPGVHAGSSDAELFEAMTGLLSALHDGHVGLEADGCPYFYSSQEQNRYLFSDSDSGTARSDERALVDNAINVYLDSACTSATRYGLPQGFSVFGTIAPDRTSLKLGYVLVLTFLIMDSAESYYDAIVRSFRGYDGVIVDIRPNYGGSPTAAMDLINRFADRKRAYCRSWYRNGPNHDDFTEPETGYITPTENAIGGIPVAVLTTRQTASASEMFVLAAKALPTFTVIGDTTYGVFGAVDKKILPNGWEFTLSAELCKSIDGACYEAIGIPPDIRIMATRAGVDAGTDAAIDKAIEILENASR